MELRKRINAKQTAKGDYYLDGTVEATAESIDNRTLAHDLRNLIDVTREEFKTAGYRVVE